MLTEFLHFCESKKFRLIIRCESSYVDWNCWRKFCSFEQQQAQNELAIWLWLHGFNSDSKDLQYKLQIPTVLYIRQGDYKVTYIYRSQQGWQQCLCKSPRSNAAITQFHPGCGEITILYTASLLLTFSGSHTPSIPPEAFLRSSYISSIIGFHSRTRALMNQLETCQCKCNRCIRIYIFLVRVAEIWSESSCKQGEKHETVPGSCSGRSSLLTSPSRCLSGTWMMIYHIWIS